MRTRHNGFVTSNWAGNVVFSAREVHTPRSMPELRALVARNPRVRALGSGHSFSTVADGTGVLVSLSGLPPEVEAQGSVALVGAGMTFADVTERLHRQGVALADLASLPQISVGGSIATGSHGSGLSRGGLHTQVAAVELVGPDGDLSWVRRGDEDFFGSVVALGALGVVTRLLMDVEPAYEMTQTILLDVPLEAVVEDPSRFFAAAYSVSLFTDYGSGTARAALKRRVGGDYPDLPVGTPATVPLHCAPSMDAAVCSGQLGVPGPWHARLPHFRADFCPTGGDEVQSELFVARERGGEALSALLGIGDRIAAALHVAEIRVVAADDHWLSPAHRRDSIAFHFTWHRDLRQVLPVLADVEQALAPFAPRHHWGKLTTAPPAELGDACSRLTEFARLRSERDPGGVFTSPFLDALLAG